MKSHKTIRSTYMDNNNLYQGLIKNNKNTDYKDTEAKKVSPDSYRSTT